MVLEVSEISISKTLNIPNGSLNSHLRFLEKNNLITFKKEIKNRKTITIFYIAKRGIDEFSKLRKRLFEVL